MTIIISSDDPRVLKLFSAFEGKKQTLLYVKRADLAKVAKEAGSDLEFAWFDIADLEGRKLKAAFKTLSTISVRWGIIDRKGIFNDAAEAFWAGAADYLGPRTDASSINPLRLKKALAWKKAGAGSAAQRPGEGDMDSNNPLPLRAGFIDSSRGWTSIKEGQEYTFTFVYIQIDKADKLLHTIGETRAASLDQEFRRMIEHSFAASGGLVWMWRDYGGLLLLPFNGKNCPVILDALRLWINRPIHFADNAALSIGFTFRMAIHIGNTVYKRPGQTGNLTSDTLNSIFHIGYKFMKNDTFYLTEEAAAFVPREISDLFVEAGSYEARKIKRMRALQ